MHINVNDNVLWVLYMLVIIQTLTVRNLDLTLTSHRLSVMEEHHTVEEMVHQLGVCSTRLKECEDRWGCYRNSNCCVGTTSYWWAGTSRSSVKTLKLCINGACIIWSLCIHFWRSTRADIRDSLTQNAFILRKSSMLNLCLDLAVRRDYWRHACSNENSLIFVLI